jgi:hypothetical protein
MVRKLLSLAIAAVLLPACADTSAPTDTRYGRYVLRSINGGQLPRQVFENSVSQISFLAGAIRLNDDFTFSDSTHVRVYRPREGDTFTSVDVAEGTFRFSGDTLHLQSTRGETYHMTFNSSGSLLQTLEGTVLLYRK